MAKIFRKRSGTTNKGMDYEIFNIANIIMDLVTDEKIKDFQISSNDADFGAFDDIVVRADLESDTDTYALQLKHSNRGHLALEQLTHEKGDFSLKKYFDSVQNIKAANVKFLLYTNLKFQVADGTKCYPFGEHFPVTLSKIYPQNSVKISKKTNYCYKFSLVEDPCSHEYDPKGMLYKTFFKNFFLYVDQESTDNLKCSVAENFKASFYGTDVECDQYVKILNEWSLQAGTKKTLNKKGMKLAIALKILSSRIQPLSFNHDNIENATIDKRIILRQAIMAFDITIFGKQSYDDLKKLWDDAKCELRDLKCVNELRTKYQVSVGYISDIDKVDSVTLSILLWLKGKCPLILSQDASVNKVLELCDGKKIILLKDNYAFTENVFAFRSLSDLKIKTPHYNQLIKKFACSLQGKEKIFLENLIKDNDEILTLIKTDDLLEMLNDRCNIGDTRHDLPVPYIERCLLKSTIDVKILENINKDTAIILDFFSQTDDLQNRLTRHNLVNVKDYLNAEEDLTTPLNVETTFELSSLCATIYLSEGRCESSEFKAICDKADVQYVHQFRVKHDGNLEWIRSKGDVNNLEKYKLPEYYQIQERDLRRSESENKINLLVSDPGMGKSVLMKSFEINGFSECFTVIVDSKDVHSFLQDTVDGYYLPAFQTLLSSKKCKMFSKRDKAIFRNFLKKKKIIYVWDALDELLDKDLDIVANIIIELSKTCVQWVTSRCHLQHFLQQKFNVLSLNLSEFNEEEQRSYIEKRLTEINPAEKVETITAKIKSSFASVEHKDILGIPLQLFMLTELFRQDRNKYLALLNDFFLLTDLYKYFIEGMIKIHYRERLGVTVAAPLAESFFQNQKDSVFEEHTNGALRLLFPDAILTKLGVPSMQNFQSHTSMGLVTEVTDRTPRFLHNSFAEYLAARYFVENRQHKKILLQVMFDQKYINVRFFFDLILAKDNPAHVAILYQNFKFIETCDRDILTSTDSGGRTLLHLACSWGQRYPKLKVEYGFWRLNYIVHDEGMFRTMPEADGYLETIESLLKICDIFKYDQIYNMTPGDYARRTKCLVAEMRVMMRQTTGLSIKTRHILNILYYSACSGYFDEFQFFFQLFKRRTKFRKVVDNVKNKTGKTLLFIAHLMGHVKIFEFLITEGANFRLAGQSLTTACLNGDYEIVKFIVQAGADINRADKSGDTPLNLASLHGHDKITEFLLQEGADTNLANKDGVTPLYAASFIGHNKIAESLVKAGADVNQANKNGVTPLYAASFNGHYKLVEFLVKKDAGINALNKDGVTPLYGASFNGHYKIVEFLLKEGADPDRVKKYGFTPLYAASFNGHYEIVELLVNAKAGINLLNKYLDTPICVASLNGHTNIVEFLSQVGADVNLANKDGITPLYAASFNGHVNIVAFLIKIGADFSRLNKDEVTLLYAASLNGHYEIVRLLVQAGADVNLGNKYGVTPICVASSNRHDKIVKFLFEAGADINQANEDGVTPLYAASFNGCGKIVEFLIQSGAGINLANKDGVTPLIAASENGHYEVVKFLVNKGADVNLPNNDGFSSLYAASFNGYDNIVEFLVDAEANINHVSVDGYTPLQIASINGHYKVVAFLVEVGADINLADKDGDAALHDASSNGHQTIVQILVKAGADINLANADGFTPLHLASKSRHRKIFEFLVKASADGNLGSSDV